MCLRAFACMCCVLGTVALGCVRRVRPRRSSIRDISPDWSLSSMLNRFFALLYLVKP